MDAILTFDCMYSQIICIGLFVVPHTLELYALLERVHYTMVNKVQSWSIHSLISGWTRKDGPEICQFMCVHGDKSSSSLDQHAR